MTAMTTDKAPMNAKKDDQEQYLLNAISVVGPWSVHDDDDGRLFYYNHETNESQWTAPDGFHGLEGEFMMKLMLQEAIARSGVWSAHDAGNGTLYYFNEKTRESVWERPADWGVETEADQKELPPPPPPLPPKKQREERTLEGKAPAKAKKEKKSKTKKHEEQPVEAPREPTPEELALQQRREEDRKRYSEQFCDMLRDKKIMPFCKWSVAFPQIATDPRFLAVPTMDERREIFEDFVHHRRTDLKSEKKQKLKDAKKRFTKFLRDHFAAQRLNGAFDPKLTLSLFLATWEDIIDPGQLKAVKEEALAFLPLAVQEKLWDKEMSAFLESTKVEREEEDRLRAYLMDKLSDRQYISWDDLVIQDNVRAFYSTQGATATLSEALQRVVVNQSRKTRRTHRETTTICVLVTFSISIALEFKTSLISIPFSLLISIAIAIIVTFPLS
ncbi:hypothetical protein Poli38472_006613 [Pythium oligandrum]|uniref:WW domain-containing protein n=1 Tax=Pythium oligandrum TaxID=41045 RepID=A0A8K1C5D5_PYTOL|nr:hypothetical protein Poli38472_006613 [Pythium oligandrum]|eukprot:TMW56603.1 hypothetical protein Poli38472_006613 [Pythium oligandrum]